MSEPIFVEVDTYRHLEHCGPNNDDNLNYRPKREINYWLNKDPLIMTEKYLIKNKICSENKLNKLNLK